MQRRLLGAAAVLGLSVGIGVEQSMAADAAVAKQGGPVGKAPSGSEICCKQETPAAFKFDPAAAKDSPGTQATGEHIKKLESPNAVKVTFEDVLVSSAKDNAGGGAAGNAGGKAGAKPRMNARKHGSN